MCCYTKPFKAASKDTLSRWIKLVMKKAGIDTDILSHIALEVLHHLKQQKLVYQLKTFYRQQAGLIAALLLNTITYQ